MEDRGSPIDKTPCIEGKDVDLYKLYRIVDKLGGSVRVSNRNMWRQVANKLGFLSTWGINQVRVHYNRYLRSFEDLNRTLGCTMVNHPTKTAMQGSRNRQISGSSRVQMRGATSRNKNSNSEKEEKNLTSSYEMEALDGEKEPENSEVEKVTEKKVEPESPGISEKTEKLEKAVKRSGKKGAKKQEQEKEQQRKKHMEEMKMTTRPRRDSTSSLAQAMEKKAQKDSIGEKTTSSSSAAKEGNYNVKSLKNLSFISKVSYGCGVSRFEDAERRKFTYHIYPS